MCDAATININAFLHKQIEEPKKTTQKTNRIEHQKYQIKHNS